MERISSRRNPLVTEFRELARAGRQGHRVLLDGPRVVGEALSSGIPIEVIVSAEPVTNEARVLLEHAAATGARRVSVPPVVLAAMSPVRQPSGLVAIGRVVPMSIAGLLGGGADFVLLVHGVQDPGNLGAIVRTAEACGASGVVAGSGSADPFGWKALRGSMGSIFRLPVVMDEVIPALQAARAAGLRAIAAVPRGGTSLPDCDLQQPCAIVLGGEGPGLPDVIIEAADERLTIPMRAPVESLNVAVAAGLILYEAQRQRAGSTPRRSPQAAGRT